MKATVGELGELCERYGFAYYSEWVLVLEGWRQGGAEGLAMARRGVVNLRAQRAFARMPYWLALIADLQGRLGMPGPASATLDAALVAGQAHQDVWWLPEVMRMRAGYDEKGPAVARLRAATAMATAHGSVALLRRCERDLVAQGVPQQPTGVLSPL